MRFSVMITGEIEVEDEENLSAVENDLFDSVNIEELKITFEEIEENEQ